MLLIASDPSHATSTALQWYGKEECDHYSANVSSAALALHHRASSSIDSNTNSIIESFEERENESLSIPLILTYQELYALTLCIAERLHHLVSLAAKLVEHQPVVCIVLEESPQLIAALLAIAKCSFVALPLSPSTPVSRLSYVLQETRSSIVITNESTRALLQQALDLSHTQNPQSSQMGATASTTNQKCDIVLFNQLLKNDDDNKCGNSTNSNSSHASVRTDFFEEKLPDEVKMENTYLSFCDFCRMKMVAVGELRTIENCSRKCDSDILSSHNEKCCQVCHIYYTSGSSGAPKGVICEHSQLRSYVREVN